MEYRLSLGGDSISDVLNRGLISGEDIRRLQRILETRSLEKALVVLGEKCTRAGSTSNPASQSIRGVAMRRRTMMGIGLLELMLSLAIISVLLVMATRYYRAARQEQQVNDGISSVQAIIAASENWVTAGNEDFSKLNDNGIQKLIDNDYLPKGSNQNPWHGNTEVRAGDNPNQIKITMNNLPVQACLDLASKLNTTTAHPDEDSMTRCADDGHLKKYEAIF